MPSTSVVAVVQDFYNTLTASNFPNSSRPKIYFDDAPVVDSGAQVYPPYVALEDTTGRMPQYQSDYGGWEDGEIALKVYAPQLGDVDAIVQAIKYNGGNPEDRSGLDFATLSLGSPLYSISVVRVLERRSFAGYGKEGPRVHLCELHYKVVTGLSAAG